MGEADSESFLAMAIPLSIKRKESMKTLNILKYTFTLVGAGMLARAFAFYSITSNFLQSAGETEWNPTDQSSAARDNLAKIDEFVARGLSSPLDQDRFANYSNLRRKLGPHFGEQG